MASSRAGFVELALALTLWWSPGIKAFFNTDYVLPRPANVQIWSSGQCRD